MKLETILLKIIKPLLIFSFIIYVFIFFITSYIAIDSFFPLNQIEGSAIFFAYKSVNFKSIYTNINEFPFLFNSYPPMHPLVLSVFLKIFEATGLSYLILSRLFTVIVEFLICATVFLIARLYMKDKLIPIVLFGFSLAIFSLHFFHGIVRVDQLTQLFLGLAIYYLLKFLKSRRKVDICLFDLFLFLSLFTKITTFMVILFIFGFSFLKINREKRIGSIILKHLVYSSAVFFLISFILNFITSGEYMKQVFYYQLYSGFNFVKATENLGRFFSLYFFWIEAVLLILLILKLNSLTTFLFSLSTFWFLVGITKNGADLNYSLELLMFSLIALAYSLSSRYFRLDRKATVKIFGFLNMITLGMVFFRGVTFYLTSVEKEEKKVIVQVIKSVNSPVLAENPFFPVLLNKEFLVNDPFALEFLVEPRKFNREAFTDYIKSNEVEVILEGTNLRRLIEVTELREFVSQNYNISYISKSTNPYEQFVLYRKKD